MTTIHELLAKLRAEALDERDKGDKFERLIQTYLKTDPEWTAKFSDVWLWSEWPGRGKRTDTGIDIVAANRGRGDFTAIQCKFYQPAATVNKGDIDSFLSASSRHEFSRRYIIDTAKSWSKNARETLEGIEPPAQRLDIGYLADAQVDWSQFSWSTPEVLVPTGKKTLRPHQQRALDEVRTGFDKNDRGKLIMACGTGKTLTSLRIAEDLVGPGGRVLFLVPSIQLLSQTLREWVANTEVGVNPFAVCSDVRVGRKTSTTEDSGISTIDLAEPATTDADALIERMASNGATEAMTVVFATYQSIDVVSKAQNGGLGSFDLIICDEAHRTTGVTLAGADESHFVKVHNGDYLKAHRRLYMTATPRVFGEDVRRKAAEAGAELANMDDESKFGPELHRLGFGDAVEAHLLTDYKVLVLAVDEDYISGNFQAAMADSGEIKLGDAAKLIGCWNGLAKHFGGEETDDRAPMRTAVAFAKDIKTSKQAAKSFPTLVEAAVDQDDGADDRNALRVEAQHVDGTMGIHERNAHLDWLKEPAPDGVCRVLTNARCLSEGVDVPALDAVLFLTPRGSQVDVVQSVGRVMRKSPGKSLGYIILPIVVPTGVAPEEALSDNERYRVVWQVLQALRSHDDRFHALVNQIELSKKRSNRLIIDNVTPRPDAESAEESAEQIELDFGFEGFRDAMYARIVKKVGERKYWESWAKDVADIAQTHVTRIKGLLADPASPQAHQFAAFLKGLRESLNDSISEADAIDMLAQHLVTRPIFEALFEGYSFADTNPVARIMETMLASLDEHPLSAENAPLEAFYASVRRRVEGVDNAEGKQKILIELYDKFFAAAFKKTVDKLGIVYTPVELVDFILRSADDVLRQEFGQGLTDEGVHILDPFTGTGTFLVRLLQSGLIKAHDLARKYVTEIHANEILLLAYYIATVNIETTYADLAGEQKEFPGLVLTDTFQSWEPDDTPDLGMFIENNERLEHLKSLPITVIIGNPPYSAKQALASDDNPNEKYPSLDEEIRKTYAERSNATNKNALYDSYRRAIKWATLRIRDRGVVAFVTNGGFIDEKTSDGMRRSLADEFSSIHIFNLRGNQKSADWRREGGKVFGEGSQATVAITVLVKNPDKSGPATIQYTDIGDYLTADQKFDRISSAESVKHLNPVQITPDEHGDWINQRRDDFLEFLPISGPNGRGVFAIQSRGVTTARDAWAYNFSLSRLKNGIRNTVAAFNESLAGARVTDPDRISWSDGLVSELRRGERARFDESSVVQSSYRPFTAERLYFDRTFNERRSQLPTMFPISSLGTTGFYVTGAGATKPFSALATDRVPDVNTWGSEGGHYFARCRYEQVEDPGMLDLSGNGEVIDGFRKIDNITDHALNEFRAAYPGESITKDDIFFYAYGVLHSPEYRETYAADLKKMLPRIPFVADFAGFAEAGRKLSELHLEYESVVPYPLDGLDNAPPEGVDPYDFFAVGDKRMRFGGKGKLKDRSVIHYNDRITLFGIPDGAYRYMLGSRSAIEWIIDRYYVKTDKASGIVNDPNDWSREVGDPRYIVDLLARVVTVSLETMKIVDELPALEVIEDHPA